jgi:hypothetical protein
MQKIEDIIRQKIPGKAKRADHESSRAAAIHLHCQACSGGTRKTAKDCQIYSCFLFPFSISEHKRPKDAVPTEEEYAALVESKASDAQRAHWDSLKSNGDDDYEEEDTEEGE